jgi:hypothetical protein
MEFIFEVVMRFILFLIAMGIVFGAGVSGWWLVTTLGLGTDPAVIVGGLFAAAMATSITITS